MEAEKWLRQKSHPDPVVGHTDLSDIHRFALRVSMLTGVIAKGNKTLRDF